MKSDIIITESAAKQIQHLLKQEKDSNFYFRIKVSGGGCAGFQYNFDFTSKKQKDDLIFKKNEINVIVDEMSLNLIKGSKIDYIKELIGSSFKISNPQASSSCGCGTSFSI